MSKWQPLTSMVRVIILPVEMEPQLCLFQMLLRTSKMFQRKLLQAKLAFHGKNQSCQVEKRSLTTIFIMTNRLERGSNWQLQQTYHSSQQDWSKVVSIASEYKLAIQSNWVLSQLLTWRFSQPKFQISLWHLQHKSKTWMSLSVGRLQMMVALQSQNTWLNFANTI